jgi:hypothetical protein
MCHLILRHIFIIRMAQLSEVPPPTPGGVVATAMGAPPHHCITAALTHDITAVDTALFGSSAATAAVLLLLSSRAGAETTVCCCRLPMSGIATHATTCDVCVGQQLSDRTPVNQLHARVHVCMWWQTLCTPLALQEPYYTQRTMHMASPLSTVVPARAMLACRLCLQKSFW